MEVAQLLLSGVSYRELVKAVGTAILFEQLLSRGKGAIQNSTFQAQVKTTGGFLLLYAFARSWLRLVSHYVPEPYLDEFFHIPQAQTYCEGRYLEWDDKITTPPGLYFLSVAFHKLWMMQCTVYSLRYLNITATLSIALIATRCHALVTARISGRGNGHSSASFHTGLNIALFPVIFFFSALYYTDVVSTLVVLLAYENHLLRVGPQRPDFLNGIWTVVLGVAALCMRQTNVFWVVVYMGGLEAAHAVRLLSPPPVEPPKGPLSFAEHIRFYVWRDSVGDMHDPQLNAAWPEDWLFCLISIGIAAVCNPFKVLRQVWPHITVLGLFVGFVAWNGGVVLGDKSNHVATIHLAQMLYIWPFFAFFSAPLLLPSVVPFLLAPFRILVSTSQPKTGEKPLVVQMINKFYYMPYILGTIALSLAIVKFNTIIHPFTLADNRHYMFYIFRYTILRSIKVRYLLVAGYTLSRWFVWNTLAGTPSVDFPTVSGEAKEKPAKNNANKTSSVSPGPPTSTALFWLLATTLSLMTAPLVEPRYFILPWVFWRLLVPSWSPAADIQSVLPNSKWAGKLKIDPRLALETIWFLAINAGTIYMFLFRPFYWKSSDGELLDDGKVQRFMW
ncbi:DIE2/ALG10 family-domain-containing protein [Cercophora newfieldiana]|uniref:Dol-P-Glc:Glc(2)Man(9)GlcNAc(2)-PP-Dol alpha-1,2-glucosyltransferase n=1 Tax=Cercophora newfieldiana TaxID=92897 RepID=A0AA40CMI1_9PEZI|nr:DIE2/ALG10 family-domain-containing protein [Cercophora newfieldiana]